MYICTVNRFISRNFFRHHVKVGFPIRIGIVGGRISNTILSNIRIIRIVRISTQFHAKIRHFHEYGQFHVFF